MTVHLAHRISDETAPDAPYVPWLVGWLGGSVIGVTNGVVRELVYADRVGDLTAHQLSAVSLTLLMGGYAYVLQTRWPLPTTRAAVQVGAAWLAMTVAFEFGFGHYVDSKSWAELFADYDVTQGRVWGLCLVAIAAAPVATRVVRMRRARFAG